MPLADVAIRRAKPSDSSVRMFDGAGLYIEIVPSGGKWWRLKYRYAGKEKRLSLGTFPDTGLKAARDARDCARKQLAAGVDPSADRKAEKEIARLAALSTLERAAHARLAHRSKAWKPGTLAMITASLENDVFPSLGSRPLAEMPRKIRHRASLSERDVPAFLRNLDAYEGELATKWALVLHAHCRKTRRAAGCTMGRNRRASHALAHPRVAHEDERRACGAALRASTSHACGALGGNAVALARAHGHLRRTSRIEQET